MKISKLVSTLVLFVFLFSLGFAGQAQDTTISFLTPSWGVPPNGVDAFAEESGITVEIQSVQMADLFSRVQVASAAGEAAADVIFITEEAISNVVATGNMLPLNDLLDNGDLDLGDFEFLDFFAIDGDRYAVPSYLQLVMMDYNVAKLAEAGYDAPPTTWGEFDEMARAAKEQGVDEYPIAMNAIHWSWWIIALSMGDPMFDEDLNPVFADEGSKAREAMALLYTWFADELISPEILAGSISQHSIWWSGVGVFHQGWQGSVRVGNNPDVSAHAPNVAYMLLPEVGNTWNLPAGIGIHVDSENVEAAWEFIKWYVDDQNMIDIYNAVGLYPSRISVSSALNEADAIEGYDVMVEQAMRVNDLPRAELWWGPWSSSVSEHIREGAVTGASSDDVIDALAEEWNELKEEYMM
ncbi:MAG: ABC transporter substrate-binding protein [Chloroflexi bacterium]|nr:ABC transporter substrate-binding protein [Chloroflexota bacterium]